MEIRFQTKEESNQQQQEDFLKLSGAERVFSFLRLSVQLKKFPTKIKPGKTSNFIIQIPSKNATGLE